MDCDAMVVGLEDSAPYRFFATDNGPLTTDYLARRHHAIDSTNPH
jgi:hypothetical protein